MSNQILTDSIIVKEALRVFKNQLGFTKYANRQYDKNFANDGAKVGDTINIKKPKRYVVTDGPILNIQDVRDESIPLTLDTQRHVGMAFTSKDLSLTIDKFSEEFIAPAVTTLANNVDFSGASSLYKLVPNAVGIPSSTALPSTLKGFTQAKAKLANNGAPVSRLVSLVDPDTEASLVEGLKGLFQSSTEIKRQYEDGVMGYAAGSKFAMSQNVPKHQIGALGGTPLVNGAATAGATTVVTDGWSNSITGILKSGDVITFAGVYSVNPQTKQSTGQLAQFAVVGDVSSNGSGQATITLDRAMYASGAWQNVTALPADNAAILIFGSASAYAGIIAPQNLVYDRDAFALGCADLPIYKGSHMCARAADDESGLSLRLWQQGDIVNDRLVTRLDILFGWKLIYPEYAVRVVGQPA